MVDAIPQKSFVSGGRQVTAVGLGGEGILRTSGRAAHARRVIEEGLAQGLTYFDSAQAYQDNSCNSKCDDQGSFKGQSVARHHEMSHPGNKKRL